MKHLVGDKYMHNYKLIVDSDNVKYILYL